MIPNDSIYEAGFKSQFFTIVLITSSLFLTAWSLTKFIINLSKNEENQKLVYLIYQKCIDIINYYLDDLKYLEDAINFIQKKFRHKQVYESVAVEDGLLAPCVKKETIYCQEYYNKILEKRKVDKELYSSVTIYLTLTDGTTLNYIPRYPWYWDGVELFTGIQPNIKTIYNPNYLSPEYIPNFFNSTFDMNSSQVYETNKTNNIKSDLEASWIEQNSISSSQPTDEEKKITTLTLTKNNSLEITFPEYSSLVISSNKEDINDQNQKNLQKLNSNKKEENVNIIESFSSKTKDVKITPDALPSIKKPKSLQNITNVKKSPSKCQQKRKYLKKLKHKKQPKVIYPSIPVNPDLTFVPLYKKNLNESRLKSRVKHADMENTYKKLKVEIQQNKSK